MIRSPGVTRRTVPEGIRITHVGLWYVLLALITAVAATNTGNNALYMVLAIMLGALLVSGVASRANVRGLAVELDPPHEVFANTPFSVVLRLANTGRLFGRWLLLVSLGRQGQPLLVPHLPRGGRSRGQLELMLRTRGRHRFPPAQVTSIFPFGLFQKGVRFRTEAELLVYPELFPAAPPRRDGSSPIGHQTTRRAGWGHDLHALRAFRRGDDPRSIHWKQTARTGELVYMEREAERSRRLAVVFDNGVGELPDEAAKQRFERLVSEAATAAVDALARGYEVQLVTREKTLPFAAGARQRLAVLEALALIGPVPRRPEPLAGGDPRVPELRVAMEPRKLAGPTAHAGAMRP
ncbi:MAG TPA: DUF58 domain-containing protein [Thermoanaerobaculia bacterium]|nr:DUF58 domain-containing protein [Thermoanaerobaculia bacterium]